MKRKLFALMLATGVFVGSTLTVFAADKSETQNDAAIHTMETTVKANVSASYTVTVPAEITLTDKNGNGTYDSTYTVLVKGNIGSGRTVEVVPTVVSNSFSSGTDRTSLSVTQTKQSWTQSEVNAENGTSTTGTVSATLSTAGNYEGSLVFECQMK